MWDPYEEFEKVVLENGLTVYASQWPSASWEKVQFIVHSGAVQDLKEREGVAHFVEHLVSGNIDKLSASDLEDFFEEEGGSCMLGQTNHFSTNYGFLLPANERLLVKGFELFGQMLINSNLQRGIEEERASILNEFRKSYPVKFGYDIDAEHNRTLYGNHYLGRMITALGNPESIQKITKQDLNDFYSRHYSSSNMSIVCLGGVSLSTVVKLIRESLFGLENAGTKTSWQRVENKFFPLVSIIEKRASHYFKEKIETAVIKRTKPFPVNGEKMTYQAIIAKEMLRKILFHEARIKRQLSYGFRLRLARFPDVIQFAIEARDISPKMLQAALEAIEISIGIALESEDLFEKIRRRKIKKIPLLENSRGGVFSGVSNDIASVGRIVTLSEEEEIYGDMNFENIREILNGLKSENALTYILKP